MASMEGRVAIVTGATQGIGRVTAEALAREGADVTLIVRDEPRGREVAAAIGQTSGRSVDVLVADLASLAEVRRVARAFRERHDRLHVLVNNAGALQMRRQVTDEGLELTFALNHLAYFLLTHELLDLLCASAPARVVNVASAAHYSGRIDWDDPQFERRRYSGWAAYSASKLMNVLFTRELARRLVGTGVTANAVHPGTVATGFARNNPVFGTVWRLLGPFLRAPEQGAVGPIHLASADLAGLTGRYFHDTVERRPSALALDDEAARRLWDLSERLTGIAGA